MHADQGGIDIDTGARTHMQSDDEDASESLRVLKSAQIVVVVVSLLVVMEMFAEICCIHGGGTVADLTYFHLVVVMGYLPGFMPTLADGTWYLLALTGHMLRWSAKA